MSVFAYIKLITNERKKQTYIPKICSLIIDKQMFLYYNPIRTCVPEHMSVLRAGGTGAMKEQKSIRRMNDGELRFYRCMLRLRRERRRRLMVSMFAMLAIACVIITGSIYYSSIKSHAGSGFKYYTSVTVETGETLWSLADQYIDYDYYKDKNRYIAEVQSINHLDDACTLMAGQTLIVPYYSDIYVE